MNAHHFESNISWSSQAAAQYMSQLATCAGCRQGLEVRTWRWSALRPTSPAHEGVVGRVDW
eukprot:7665179-Alexandrium_andersonii.AAC.1